MAAKEGGPDPEANATLAAAIAKARSYSMPKDNIERAVQRGAGTGEGADAYEAVTYEGYGPDGVAIIVEALTDNRNRTAADVRSIFSKHNSSLGTPGSVAWQFERKGDDPGARRRRRRGRHRAGGCRRRRGGCVARRRRLVR